MVAFRALAAAVLLGAVLGSPARAEGDAVAGEKVFKKCMACHKVGEGAKNSVGPILNGVIGRHAGTVEGYSYSRLNSNSGANGLVWTEAAIFDYLADPEHLSEEAPDRCRQGRPDRRRHQDDPQAAGRSRPAECHRVPEEILDGALTLQRLSALAPGGGPSMLRPPRGHGHPTHANRSGAEGMAGAA